VPLFVMGLFGFLGKAVKGIGKAVGGVAKIGLSLAGSGLLPIPGGGLLGKVAGGLIAAKRPLSNPKMALAGTAISILRGKNPGASPVFGGGSLGARGLPVLRASTPRLQSNSPVLPGGAIATRAGPVSQAGTPPLNFSGSGTVKRKRRKRSAKRSRASSRRRTRGRKLKFGSPAWRKKYLGHGRKRKRRRRAA
jgi:hypothetical protein